MSHIPDIYFWFVIMQLGEKRQVWGLDKFWGPGREKQVPRRACGRFRIDVP